MKLMFLLSYERQELFYAYQSHHYSRKFSDQIESANLLCHRVLLSINQKERKKIELIVEYCDLKTLEILSMKQGSLLKKKKSIGRNKTCMKYKPNQPAWKIFPLHFLL